MKLRPQTLLQLLIVILVTSIGLLTLRGSSADTLGAVVEAENGSLTGNTAVLSDPSASAGKTISFGVSNYGPQPATMPANAVTPEQYGATGNGTTDDFSAVQAAITAAAASGKTAWLSAGKTYLCGKQVALPSNTVLRGGGPSSALKFTWFDASQSSSGKDAYVRSKNQQSGESNITIANFTIIGGGSGNPSGLNADNPNGLVPAVQMNLVDGFSITNMQIMQSPGISITYRAATNGNITGNYVHDSGRDGITGFWSPLRNLTNIKVSNNYITRVGDDGIAINGLENFVNNVALPSDIVISNNTIEGWESPPNNKLLGRGIAVIGAKNLTVTKNSVINTTGAGIMLVACSNTFCKPGSVNPATGQPWQSSGLTVTDNTITNAGRIPGSSPGVGIRGGIYVNATTASSITGNIIVNAVNKDIDNVLCSGCNVQ